VFGWGRSFAYVEIIDHKEAAQIHISKISNRYINDIADVLKKGEIIVAKILNDTPDIRYGFEMAKVQ